VLVVIGDIHLTDGSSGDTIHAGALRSFVEKLEASVEDACWRRDGTFVIGARVEEISGACISAASGSPSRSNSAVFAS
jgi:hypothetical protein